jgi:hypothetical protein
MKAQTEHLGCCKSIIVRVILAWEKPMFEHSPRTHVQRALTFIGSVFILALSAALLAATSDKPAAAGVFQPDKGKFTIQLAGQTVGHEDFEIARTGEAWTAKGTTELKPMQGAVAKVTGTLTLQADGAPISYEWSAQTDKTNGAHILFANGIAKITLQMQGARPFEQDLTFGAPLVTVLDNNLYHQYAVLARVYDWSKRGAQTFPVLIPQELTPGTIQVEAVDPAKVGDKSYEGLRVTTADLEVLLALDSTHRLMRLEVPAAKVSVLRD